MKAIITTTKGMETIEEVEQVIGPNTLGVVQIWTLNGEEPTVYDLADVLLIQLIK